MLRPRRHLPLQKVHKHSDVFALVIDILIAVGSLAFAGALVLLLAWNS